MPARCAASTFSLTPPIGVSASESPPPHRDSARVPAAWADRLWRLLSSARHSSRTPDDCAANAVPDLLDLQRPASGAFALGQSEAQNAVLELGNRCLVVHVAGEREAARDGAAVGLANQRAAVLLFLLLPDFGRDRDVVAVDRDANFFLLGAGDLCAHEVFLVVLADVDADVGRQRVLVHELHRTREAAKQLGKQIVDSIEAGQCVHLRYSGLD